MSIRITHRAIISEEFKQEMIEVFKSRLIAIKEELDNAPTSIVSRLRDEQRAKITRLVRLINNKPHLDRELTKLRSLPYISFDKVSVLGIDYLYGRTKPIIMTDNCSKWEIGEYGIYTPLIRLKTGQINSGFDGDWHFIPFNDPKAFQRTPHHHGNHSKDKHPLSEHSSTCWGTFGSTIPSILQDGDIVELFRAIHIYIERYNPSSPLGDIRNMAWIKKL